MRIVRILSAWLVATAATTLLASLIHSLRVQAGLADLGVALPPGLRLRTMLRDFAGIAPLLWPIVGVAMALGFAVAALLRRRWRVWASVAYPLAGAAALGAALLAMRLAFSMTPVAGARGPWGFAAMCLAGALGGWLFARRIRAPR